MNAPLSSADYARQERLREKERQEAEARAETEREERERQEESLERQFQQLRLLLEYDAYFIPALQDWLALPYRLDPMRKQSDAFALIAELARRKVAMSPPEYNGEQYTVLLTAPIPGGWKVGRKTGDTLAEALTLSVWEILSNG